jgi:dTDP-4-amino-4,6-dideoxygalactose transaminase
VQAELLQTPVKVPFVDLRPTNEPVRGSVLEAVDRLLTTGQFTNGPEVGAFETMFAACCGTRFCIGVASGLDALRLALVGAEVSPGGEVIVPANTFAATSEAVVQAGGVPVFVDAGEADYNIDAAGVEAAVTSRTECLLPVHLYGQLADVAALAQVARRHDVLMIEDACQAHGATRDGRRAGSVGLAGAFSFYPTKNLGASGDAGGLTTDNEALAARVRALREHGQARKYEHDCVGYTGRLDTIQALVLLRKLPHLERWNEERRRAAAFYTRALTGVGDLRLPPVPVDSEPVWHLYVARTAKPESLASFLAERGIATGRHYPQPLHLSPAFAYLGYKQGAFPVAEALARECLSLPLFPGISEGQLAYVVEAVEGYFRGG